jgi:hypothetical protein
MIDKGIRYKERKEVPMKRVAKTTKEELMYYLSPVYGKDAIKDLDEDQLKELLDELTETFYKVKKKQGGVIKDPTFTKYFSDGGSADDDKPKPIDPLKLMLQINAMSDAEREQLEYMLEKLGVKKK